MTKQEDPREKSRRDLLLILLILPFGCLLMFIIGQAAIRLAPTWLLPVNMFSNLDPDADFAGLGVPQIIEPLDPGILNQPARDNPNISPNDSAPNAIVVVIPPPPIRTPQPPPVINTPDVIIPPPLPTATIPGVVVLPTKSGPILADLDITKTDSSNTYTPGTTINYTIDVKNNGPDPAPRFNVSDSIPADISGLTMNCTPAWRCGTNTSSGNTVSFSNASLETGEQLSITVSGLVASSTTGNLSNTAEVTIPRGAGFKDVILVNNITTDTDTLYAISDLAITKTSPSNSYTATNPITYTVVVTNNGPSDAQGVRIVDNKPSQIESWTWQCTTVFNAAGCNGVTGSTFNFIDNGVRIQVGGRIEYTVTAYLPTDAYLSPSNIVNTARVLLSGNPSYVDPTSSNNTSPVTINPYIDLQITKTDNGAAFSPGGTFDYTVTVTNNSTFDLTDINVSDSIPSPTQVTNWTWACTTPNPSCDGVTNSSTDFTDAIDLTAGSSQVYTVTVTITGTPGFGDITNTAAVSAPTGLVDADTSNDSATETTPPYIDLAISKSDGGDSYTQGGPLTYTVTVTNNSGFDLTGITVVDVMPALISSWSWTCTSDPGPPGPICAAGTNTTSINDTAVELPAGRSVIYTVDAVVSTTAIGELTNTATVTSGYTDVVPGNNTAQDINTRLFEYTVTGPPDGFITGPSSGSSVDYTLTNPITIDGNTSDYEIVYYERNIGDNTIDLDQVIVSISTDGTTWYRVYYWGDNTPDSNASPPGQTSEPDNYNMPTSLFYGTLPYQTGILIDADGGLDSPPPGLYPYIRVTAPSGDADGGCDIDSIGVWP